MPSSSKNRNAKRPDPLVGSLINGRYRVSSVVAAGGMGKVYRAEQIQLGRDVALKVLHVRIGSNGEESHFKHRFFREANLLAKLQHPNIVTVFDYGAIERAEEQFFMAMEFLSGETLRQRVRRRGALGTVETIGIARQIARGLSEAHAHGIVHRDLKPSNVMLVDGRDGEELVKIVDFGIVKVMSEDLPDEDLTQEGSFIGSPNYMAPEQIGSSQNVDTHTDVHAFGVQG